jgi:hypothetical protein
METARDEIRVFDRSPLLVVEFSGFPTDEQFKRYLGEVEAIAERRSREARGGASAVRGALLIDTTASTRPVTATQRRLQAEHIRRMKSRFGAQDSDGQTAVVFVITQMLVRGVLTAVLWLQPSGEHFKVCATRAEADEYVRQWILGTISRGDRPAA